LAHRPDHVRRGDPVIQLIISAIATAGCTSPRPGVQCAGCLKPACAAPWPHHRYRHAVHDHRPTMITMIMVPGAPTRPLMIITLAASLTRIACSITTLQRTNLMRV